MIHPLLNELATEFNFKMIMKNRGKIVSAAKDWLIKKSGKTTSSLNTFQPALELNELVTLDKMLKVKMGLIIAKDNKISLSIASFNPFTDLQAPQKTDTV